MERSPGKQPFRMPTAEERTRRTMRRARARWTVFAAITVAAGVLAAVAFRAGSPLPGALAAVACAALSAAMIAALRVQRGLVHLSVYGSSMEPAFHDGDRVLVRRRPGHLETGQVVVIERPLAPGHWTAEPLTPKAGVTAILGRQWLVKRVTAVDGDQVTIHSDSPAGGLDSTQLGPLPRERVLGVVIGRVPGRSRA